MNIRYTILTLPVIALLFLSSCNREQSMTDETANPVTPHKISTAYADLIPDIAYDVYGMPVSGFEAEEGRVQRYDNLARILGRYEVPYKRVHQLAEASDGVFNLGRIRRGNPYKVYYRTKADGREPVRWIYHVNPVEYISFELDGDLQVERKSFETEVRIRKASGIISHSLYRTMLDQGIPRNMVQRLSEVFAWQVDFFRVQQGDRFKVIYEEEYANGELIGTGNIHGAVFEHRGQAYNAVRFEQNGTVDYFDEDGQSLRREFLRAPLEYTRISSGFTHSRYHPVLRENRPHHGVDYAAPRGTPIYSVGDGTITEARYTSGNGNYVKIRHNNTYTTQYLHMTRFADGIRPGVRVEQKEVIGYVGATGLATGPHVCFRFYKHGRPVNPRTVEMPPSDPVEDDYMEEYKKTRDSIMRKLDRIGYQQAWIGMEDSAS